MMTMKPCTPPIAVTCIQTAQLWVGGVHTGRCIGDSFVAGKTYKIIERNTAAGEALMINEWGGTHYAPRDWFIKHFRAIKRASGRGDG